MADKNATVEEICQKYPLLLEHLREVLQHNSIVNLTSIKNLEAGKVLHIEDSLACLPELSKAPEGTLLDLGSGAGYPGIPLAIVSGRNTRLVESNKKKASFLSKFVCTHRLAEQITVCNLRSEELAKIPDCKHAVVILRAVTELPGILELGAPLLEKHGHIIALKGRPESSEIDRGNIVANKAGLKLIENRSYMLSDGKSRRCVLVYEKVGDPEISLPRRPGMAAKRPLA